MKRILSLIVLILLLTVNITALMPITGGELEGWSEDIRLTFNDARSISPAIAAEGNNVHVVYTDDEDAGHLEWFLWYINSNDCGNTWNPPICLVSGPSTRISSPKIAVNGSNIHVIWLERNDNKIHYIHSLDNGNTWSTDMAISFMVYHRFVNWDIAVCGNNLHVVYSDSNHKLTYIRSNDNGFTWSVPQILILNKSVSVETAIAVNEDKVHIVWRDTERAGHLIGKIFYIKSEDNGATWEEDINITDISTNSDYYVDIAVTNDSIYVVYGHDETKRQVYFSYSEDNGNTWIRNIKLSNSTHNIFDPAIAAESDNISLVWTDNRDKGGGSEIYFKSSSDRGIMWSVDTRLTNTPEISSSPDIVINEKIVHVVWTEGTPYEEIYYKWMSIPLPIISASVDIKPDTLNLKSKGRWITAYIELPDGYDVNDINVSTIKISDINGSPMYLPAESHPTEINDYDRDGILDLKVKFDRSELEDNTSLGDAMITVTGEYINGTFEGSDTVRTILPP